MTMREVSPFNSINYKGHLINIQDKWQKSYNEKVRNFRSREDKHLEQLILQIKSQKQHQFDSVNEPAIYSKQEIQLFVKYLKK